MAIFKTIATVYKDLKAIREKSLVQLQISSEEYLKKRNIEMEKKYKHFFENSENHIDVSNELSFYSGEISKDEYEKNEIKHKQKIKQAKLDVDSGKISHEDFFDIARNKSNK